MEEQILEFGGVLGVQVCASVWGPKLAKHEKRTHEVSLFHICERATKRCVNVGKND